MTTSTITASRVKRRGFASMTRERNREVASMGGIAAHRMGRAHKWTSKEAREAGRKGGAISRRRSRYFREEL